MGLRAKAHAVSRSLDSRWAPVVAGVLTALFVGWIWGSLREPSFVHDEAAYRLQAEIFASFHLSGAPPPLPEFFEQYHVLLVPRLAPKYWPGHALLLVPGIWLGWPGLVPVLLHGLSGGLLFALARRLARRWVGLLAWLLWLSAPMLNAWRATYLSQSTSTALWMLALWALLRWWTSGGRGSLVALAAAVAWMGITRPLTAVALALPVGLLVLVGTWRRRDWASLAPAAATGLAILAVLPIWAFGSTGDPWTLPYMHYTQVYFPYETLGFGEDEAPSQRELPPDMRVFDEGGRATHRAHTLAGLPNAFVARLREAGREEWGYSTWRPILLGFFALGLLGLDRRGWFAMACAASPFVVYLAYAHPPNWAVYYHEVHPILAFVTALGIVRAPSVFAKRSLWASLPSPDRIGLLAAPVAVLVLALGLADATVIRKQVHQRTAFARDFARTLEAVTEEKAIVFVRYHRLHNPHRSLIENPPDFSRARIWVARDRGADNRRLAAAAPDRALYLFDEASGTLYRLQPR
jgi:hypothetical protein